MHKYNTAFMNLSYNTAATIARRMKPDTH